MTPSPNKSSKKRAIKFDYAKWANHTFIQPVCCDNCPHEVKGKEKEECQHDKVFSNIVLTSNPPQYPWICRKCGFEGVDRGTMYVDEYSEIKRRFGT